MIEKLRKILPIPKEPIDTNDAGLKKTTKALKVQFPDDYLEYCKTYGSGTIEVGVYDWEIYSAFRPTYSKFVKHFFERQDVFRRGMETTGLPLGLFPEPNGLLPFGHRDDVYFCWQTKGDPDSWTVCVIWEYQEGGYQLFKKRFCEFLTSLLTRKITVGGFKSAWNPKTDITFTPEVYGD